jgi:hypothetical protein
MTLSLRATGFNPCTYEVETSQVSKFAFKVNLYGYIKVPGSCAIPFSGFDRALRGDPSTLDKVALASAAVAVAGLYKLNAVAS